MGGNIFLCRFSLMSVEMNGLSVGGCLFGMVIWADFLLLKREFLGKMVGVDMVMEVVVEVVVEAVDVGELGFLSFPDVVVWGI